MKKRTNKSLEILNYWNTLGLRKHSKPNTKVYKQSLKNINSLLKGKFVPPEGFDSKYRNRKFTVAEIQIAIQRFAVATLNPNYVPANKEFLRKVSLCDFIFAPYAEGEWKSKFLMYLETKPEKLRPAIKKDKYPKTTERLAELYCIETNKKVGKADMKFVVRASAALHEFMKQNSKKFKSDLTMKGLSKILIQTVKKRFRDEVNPSALCAPFVYSDLLIENLKEKRYM